MVNIREDKPADDQIQMRDVLGVVEGLSILDRLKIAKLMVFNTGGDDGGLGTNPMLIAACKIMGGVIDVLNVNPDAAELKYAEPPEERRGSERGAPHP